MNKFDSSVNNSAAPEPPGDIDDLIFYHDPDWYISDR